MTVKQLAEALKIAKSDQDLGEYTIEKFDGFGLADFQPVACTITELAQLLRWQCMGIFGNYWDTEAEAQIRECGRRRFIIAD